MLATFPEPTKLFRLFAELVTVIAFQFEFEPFELWEIVKPEGAFPPSVHDEEAEAVPPPPLLTRDWVGFVLVAVATTFVRTPSAESNFASAPVEDFDTVTAPPV